MNKLIAFSIFLFSFSSLANINQSSETIRKNEGHIAKGITFGYSLQLLGPSLDSDYQAGATYNRFKTGQDIYGQELDHTASYQTFHAISLGYKIRDDIKVSYGFTFQEDLNDKIEYTSPNKFGPDFKYERAKGISDNNKRINLFVSNIYSNNHFYINSNQFIEFASTTASEGNDMEYGLGFQPSLNFYSKVPGLYYGITSSVQRNYYKEQQFFEKCGNTFCKYPRRYQTLLAELGVYANYVLTDVTTLQFSLAFDWDQKGDQVETNGIAFNSLTDIQMTNEFNKNMHDVGRIGAKFQIHPNANLGTFLEFAIESPSIEKTALGANFSLYL